MKRQRKLVVSWDTYSWIHHLAGLIAKEPKSFEIIVVTKDGDSPIYGCKELCKEAVYAQRAYDLFKVGTELGVRKLANMLYDDDTLDVEVLTAKLQMQVVLTGVNIVYFQQNIILEHILRAVKNKINIELYAFDNLEDYPRSIINLSETELVRKQNLLTWMVGLPQYGVDYTEREYIYKI